MLTRYLYPHTGALQIPSLFTSETSGIREGLLVITALVMLSANRIISLAGLSVCIAPELVTKSLVKQASPPFNSSCRFVSNYQNSPTRFDSIRLAPYPQKKLSSMLPVKAEVISEPQHWFGDNVGPTFDNNEPSALFLGSNHHTETADPNIEENHVGHCIHVRRHAPGSLRLGCTVSCEEVFDDEEDLIAIRRIR
ncbi:hypothetical protein AZE42_05571 [Rhizopogon vesiculosus]|uniref:Uncharacterized protein n=1 Tax=Rhizopogon vesiculosus TaxID=180088 RepID=A0A1J8QJU2_9AGAM|nr:hypothetical protein AZE42_05571 [Rhizopogon vesiculosus]